MRADTGTDPWSQFPRYKLKAAEMSFRPLSMSKYIPGSFTSQFTQQEEGLMALGFHESPYALPERHS